MKLAKQKPLKAFMQKSMYDWENIQNTFYILFTVLLDQNYVYGS